MEPLLEVLQEISGKLSEISSKLDIINGAYGIDDIAQKIDDAADKIMGMPGYSLADIYQELSAININTMSLG